MPKFEVSSIKIILLASFFITLFDNQAFFSKIFERLDVLSLQGAGYTASLFLIIFFILLLFQFIFATKYLLKPLVIFLLLISAIMSYFTQELRVVFDEDMIRNTVETIKDNNKQEAAELLSAPLIYHVVLYGVLPSILILFTQIKFQKFTKEVIKRTIYLGGVLLLIAVLILLNFKYISFFSRENRDLRFYATPLFGLDSARYYIRENLIPPAPFKVLGADAIQSKKTTKRTIGIIVVGETARAANFSINSYARETNPLLQKEAIINYTKASSCGTSTAYSVPCMFSFLDRDSYSPELSSRQSNTLDVLIKAGIKVHWLDNNSSCKGVCDRFGELNLRKNPDPKSPFYSAGEVFDEALISEMERILSSENTGSDVLFILHTLGSHGPKYYKRYPKEFSQFEPACKKATPQACNKNEIINAYDNTILYTDYFLAQVIQTLKKQQTTHNETFMLYASDHGESLGENGVYLHGLPYFIAPKEQTEIPLFMWLSDAYLSNHALNKESLKRRQDANDISHDNLSHTLLGAFNVKTTLYKEDYDLLK